MELNNEILYVLLRIFFDEYKNTIINSLHNKQLCVFINICILKMIKDL